MGYSFERWKRYVFQKILDESNRKPINFDKKNSKEDPKFKVDDHDKNKNKNFFLQKIAFQTGRKKLLWL